MEINTIISIIMPAFNAQYTISEAIDSVIKQDFIKWELIIIDDGSIDDTINIVNIYLKRDKRIKLISLETNNGLPNARNKGISMATGKYVTFLDSDDLWLPNKLTLQYFFHQKNPEIKISHTAYQMFSSIGITKKPIREYFSFLHPKKRKLIPLLYKRNFVGILTVMVEKDLLLTVGSFDNNLWTMEDHDLWIRIAKTNQVFGFINKDLGLYRISSNGISNKIGKYKRAYKTLIDKHKEDIIAYNSLAIAMANYYCLFGASYFKKGNYVMANLYFYKAISSCLFSFTTVISLFYTFSIRLKLS